MTHPVLRCPSCHATLTSGNDALRCDGCDRIYPVQDGIADFSGGRYYDNFDPSTRLTPEAEQGLALEFEGAKRRIIDYYEPALRKHGAVRVLDCGTGNGVAVDVLNERGFEGWGADLSALRKYQWRERVRRDRLVVADVASLPFPDGYFDAIIASGVLEHIGVQESRTPRYTVHRLADRDEQRRRVLEELLRITSASGTLFLDFPNGAFPIDFWHGDAAGSARFHRTTEGFLPHFEEIVSLVQTIDPRARVRALSPYRRLQFVQSATHWYGRLLSAPARIFLALMRGRLAQSALNPFLVIQISKRSIA